MPMMISLFDWIWIGIIAVTTTGAVAYCVVMARHEVQEELESLRNALEHQRNRKRLWKAKAKGLKTSSPEESLASPIHLASRSKHLGATGSSN